MEQCLRRALFGSGASAWLQQRRDMQPWQTLRESGDCASQSPAKGAYLGNSDYLPIGNHLSVTNVHPYWGNSRRICCFFFEEFIGTNVGIALPSKRGRRLGGTVVNRDGRGDWGAFAGRLRGGACPRPVEGPETDRRRGSRFRQNLRDLAAGTGHSELR